jgi:hypothetical protein
MICPHVVHEVVQVCLPHFPHIVVLFNTTSFIAIGPVFPTREMVYSVSHAYQQSGAKDNEDNDCALRDGVTIVIAFIEVNGRHDSEQYAVRFWGMM